MHSLEWSTIYACITPQYSKMLRNYFVSQLESLRQIHHPTGCEYMEQLELVKKDFTAKGSSSPARFEIYEVPIMCSIKCCKVAGLVYARFVVRGVMVSGWKGRLHKHKQKLESPPFNAVVASSLDFQGSSIICNTMAKQKDSWINTMNLFSNSQRVLQCTFSIKLSIAELQWVGELA